MKIKTNRERVGKKIVQAPTSIDVYSDNNKYLGRITFAGFPGTNLLLVDLHCTVRVQDKKTGDYVEINEGMIW